ncbi:hypothetical protein HDZ31DRAFT_28189 [Schizophyllum fasciatum]
MGFCRRCGDIVSGPRCRCGGAPVAPSVPWNQTESETDVKDRWSQTYVVNRERAQSLSRPPSRGPPSNPSIISQTAGDRAPQTKRFPKPANSYSSSSSSVSLGDRVSRHIANTTSQLNSPPSPLKHAITGPSPEADILPSIHTRDPTLSKVYGSVLQPKESLATHCCSVCSDVFLPDSTIYPDPSAPNPDDPTFVCRDCYTMRGGCKGICPGCSKEVLTLKSEGGFVHAAGAYYHKKCFTCDGCGKSIGEKPMVDLLGRPCCPDCFDTCLKRESTPKKTRETALPSSPQQKATNIGGLNADAAPGRMSFPKSRESSPALQELEQRLGIASRRDSSATLEELSQRLNKIGRESPTRSSRYSSTSSAAGSPRPTSSPRLAQSRIGSPPRRRYDRFKSVDFDALDRAGSQSPIRRQRTGSMVTDEALEAMKRRFIKDNTPPALVASLTGTSRPASPPRSPVVSPTPDLVSDVSDTATSVSSIETPPRSDYRSLMTDKDEVSISKIMGSGLTSRYTARDQFNDILDDVIVEETRSQLNTPNRTPQRNTASASPRSSITSPRASITSPRASLTSPITSPRSSLASPITSPPLTGTSSCDRCKGPLFGIGQIGKFVTVPGDAGNAPRVYHTKCFLCVACDEPFADGGEGQATFVKGKDGPCHIECAPPETIHVRTIHPEPLKMDIFSHRAAHSTPPPNLQKAKTTPVPSSSRYEAQPRTAPSTQTSFPRFGGSMACPGCQKNVSPMERGVVAGPQNTKWHGPCLVCGGKKESPKGWLSRGREERKKGEPGCGKKLDSAAKLDANGGVWCRECSLLLNAALRASPQSSPTRTTPNVPLPSGSTSSPFSKVAQQTTGTTTLARQFTGMSGGGDQLARQHTGGGGLPPTRSISPTKQLRSTSPSKPAIALRPRPKSALGMRTLRGSKSVDEGRGMFLVRQLTGQSTGA